MEGVDEDPVRGRKSPKKSITSPAAFALAQIESSPMHSCGGDNG